MKNPKSVPIFFDETEKRGKRARRIFIFLIFLISTCIGIFGVSIFLHPILPLPENFVNIFPQIHVHPAKNQYVYTAHKEKIKHVGISQYHPIGISSEKKIYGFGVEWDDTSFASLQEHRDQMDGVILEELTLSGGNAKILNQDKWNRTLNFLKKGSKPIEIIPLINNFNQETNTWDGKGLYDVLSDDTQRRSLIKSIKNFVSTYGLGGINIDFEEVDDKSFPYYISFLNELGIEIHILGGKISVNVPMTNDAFDLEEINKNVDTIFLMAYDEHWATAEPGPIASLDWFTEGVKNALTFVPKEKLNIIIGNYGYDWTLGKKESTARTFQEVHTIMGESEENISFDTGSLNPMFSYTDDNNKDHELWYLDAITAYNEIKTLDTLGVNQIGLWRLGSEDPSFWKIQDSNLSQTGVLDALKNFSYGYEIDYEGTGEFYKLQSDPRIGSRNITTLSGMITDESILNFPLPYTIGRHGGLQDKKVLLSFDDGPDPNITPQILDILKKEKVPALFFVIGENAGEYPFLIKRIFDEGHTIGNHSYSHPDISKIGSMRMNLELTSTERILESILGHKTILFRPPYGEDIEPEIPSQVIPLEESNRLGYLTVGMKIDPNDWANPGVDTIVERTVEQAVSGRGNIVLLHDAGGDRKQTIEALPKIIETLRSRGYTFVQASDLLGENRESLMPSITGNDAALIVSDSITFWVLRIMGWGLFYLFMVALIFGVFRLVIILIFAMLEKLHIAPNRIYPEMGKISTSVIIPAYNEAKVIQKTIDSLLQSTYPNFDIIVIDDGSTDGTPEIVRKYYQDTPQVRLFEKQNSGKGESMNYGLTHTDAEIVIVIDADTIFSPKTIELLVRHFHNPEVGAVSGNVKVGNRINFLTRVQTIEYITSQNIDKRAYNMLGVITVVPGAVGAWRREALIQLGGFPLDTLAEDSDMTLMLLRAGYLVEHEEYAYAYTEAPETWGAFMKQRFRWTFGILQVTRKHIGILKQENIPLVLRFFILPSFILSQVIVPIIAPIIDIFLVGTLVFNTINYILYGSFWYLQTIGYVFLFICILILLDLIIGIIAIAFEKDEKKSLLIYFLPQRLLYRFFMYWINLKSLWSACHGALVGWGKLERSNSVSIDHNK